MDRWNEISNRQNWLDTVEAEMKRLTEKLAGNGANVDNEQKMAEAREKFNAMVQNRSKANWVDQAFNTAVVTEPTL